MKLSEQIKKYRKDNNMTQTDFAKKLYVSKQAISKWENDLGLPDVSLYPVLSEILNVSIDELMGKKKKSNSNKKIIIILGISTIVLFVLLFIILNKFKLIEVRSSIKQFYLKLLTCFYYIIDCFS